MPFDIRPRPRPEISTARGLSVAPSVAPSRLYLVQLVDQLDRLQLERVTSTPVLSVELQLDRLQLERVKSRPRLLSAVLQDDRLHEERL